MPPEECAKTVDEIKSKGNALYVKRQFKQARQMYRKALELNPSAAVLLSNISACEYELGRYTSCVAKVDSALTHAGKDSRLRAKLLVRKKKCLFHLYRLAEVEACAKELLDLATEDESVREFIDVSGVVDKYLASSHLLEDECKDARGEKDEDEKLINMLDTLPRGRPPSGCHPLEFYSIGNEYVCSLFSCPEATPKKERTQPSHKFIDGDRKRLRVSALSDEERQRVNLFFGGVGDHRHLFVTLVDLQKQLRADKDSTAKAPVQCRMVLNDIHPAAFARIAVVFLALQDLGKYRWEDIVSGANQEGVRVATFLQYVYMFPVLPPFVSDMLHAYFDRLLASESAPPPLDGLSMPPPEWARVLEVVADWRAEETERWSLDARKAANFQLGPPPRTPEQREVERQARLNQVDQMSDSELKLKMQALGSSEGLGSTPSQARHLLKSRVMAMDNDRLDVKLPLGGGALSEHLILRKHKVLLLPRQLRGVGEDDAMAAVRAAAAAVAAASESSTSGVKVDQGDLNGLVRAFRHRVDETWRSNVTLVHRPILEEAADIFSPAVQFVDMSSLLCDLYYQSETEEGEGEGDGGGYLIPYPPSPTGLFDWSAKFFCEVAGALRELVPGTARLEWRLGDAFDVLRAEARACGNGAMGRPYEPSATATATSVISTPGVGAGGGPFMGVRLSNVPDYSGLLRTLIHSAPALAASPSTPSSSPPSSSPPLEGGGGDGGGGGVPPFLTSLILLNNPDFENYTQWVGRNLCVERNDLVVCLLGFGYVCGGINSRENRWGSAGVMKGEGLVRREQLRVWLHTVFLYIVLPPFRSCHSPIAQRLSYNLVLFLELVSFLSHHRGYPSHWLTGILEEMLTGSVLTSPSALPSEEVAEWIKVEPPSEEVATLSGSVLRGSVHVDLRPFLVELRALARMWMPVLGFPLAVPGLLAGPPATRGGVVKLTLSGMKPVSYADYDEDDVDSVAPPNPVLPVIALVLQHPSKRIAVDEGNGEMSFIGDERLKSSLLCNHRSKGKGGWEARAVDQGVHLITVVEWAHKKGEVSFRVGEKDLGVLSKAGYEAVLVRTDFWCVASTAGLLSTAVVC